MVGLEGEAVLRKPSQSQRRCSSVSLVMTSSQSARSMLGVGPADRTGKSWTRYWPGGSSTLGRRRPRNPRDTVPIVVTPCGLAEGEGVGLDTGVEEGDLQGAVGDRAGLAQELVQPRLGEGAVALLVEVGAVGGTRGLVV